MVGWGRALGMDRVVLVDDTIAETPWEQDLYRLGVPEGMEVEFVSVTDAARRLATWEAGPEITGLVIGTVDTAVRLADLAALPAINLGGVHHRPERRERLPYVFLTDHELQSLLALAARGIAITAQDVPTARAVPIEALR